MYTYTYIYICIYIKDLSVHQPFRSFQEVLHDVANRVLLFRLLRNPLSPFNNSSSNNFLSLFVPEGQTRVFTSRGRQWRGLTKGSEVLRTDFRWTSSSFFGGRKKKKKREKRVEGKGYLTKLGRKKMVDNGVSF